PPPLRRGHWRTASWRRDRTRSRFRRASAPPRPASTLRAAPTSVSRPARRHRAVRNRRGRDLQCSAFVNPSRIAAFHRTTVSTKPTLSAVSAIAYHGLWIASPNSSPVIKIGVLAACRLRPAPSVTDGSVLTVYVPVPIGGENNSPTRLSLGPMIWTATFADSANVRTDPYFMGAPSGWLSFDRTHSAGVGQLCRHAFAGRRSGMRADLAGRQRRGMRAMRVVGVVSVEVADPYQPHVALVAPGGVVGGREHLDVRRRRG